MRLLGSYISVKKARFLEISYGVAIMLLLLAVVFTPFFIRHHFLLFKKYVIQEDSAEAVLIIILLLITYLLSQIYKRELQKYRQETMRLSRDNCDLSSKLLDAFKYIGGVNVQIQGIRSLFCEFKKYPATESEFRNDLASIAHKVLGIVNADWVLIRIIRQSNFRTIKEHFEHRKNALFLSKGISNKAIVADQEIDGYSTVTSHRDNSMILTVCVFPKKSLDTEEKILIEAITNQIEMFYLIFVSRRLQENYIHRNPLMRIQKN